MNVRHQIGEGHTYKSVHDTIRERRHFPPVDLQAYSYGFGEVVGPAQLTPEILRWLRKQSQIVGLPWSPYMFPDLETFEVDSRFDRLVEEGDDEPMPSADVFSEAKRIVRQLHLPEDADLYVLDGGIAVELYGSPGHGFLLICEPGGGALCIVTVAGVSRRARYESSDVLPDGFVVEGLASVLP